MNVKNKNVGINFERNFLSFWVQMKIGLLAKHTWTLIWNFGSLLYYKTSGLLSS
jgi:hypothetical protein